MLAQVATFWFSDLEAEISSWVSKINTDSTLKLYLCELINAKIDEARLHRLRMMSRR